MSTSLKKAGYTHPLWPDLSLLLTHLPRTTTTLIHPQILKSSPSALATILHDLQSSCGKVYDSLVSNSFLPLNFNSLVPFLLFFYKYLAHRSARYFFELPKTKQKQTQLLGLKPSILAIKPSKHMTINGYG